MLAGVLEWIADGRLDPVGPVTYPPVDAAGARADRAAREVACRLALVP